MTLLYSTCRSPALDVSRICTKLPLALHLQLSFTVPIRDLVDKRDWVAALCGGCQQSLFCEAELYVRRECACRYVQDIYCESSYAGISIL